MKVATLAISALLIGASTAAFAQQKAPPVAPFTVTPQEYAALQQYLSEKPYSVAAPLIAFFDRKESAAAQAAMSAKHPAHKREDVTPSKGK